ncbi:hypothetical protein ACSFC1_07645 [Pseudothermotoga sp. U03pept]|uniref:hypothetical protein n=1 Tax=Pseudothermotoga sp. U03pept TaxID=3447012 RepID=UPI003F0A9CE2
MNKLIIASLLVSVLCFGFTFKFDGWIEYDFDKPTDVIKFTVNVSSFNVEFTTSGGFKRDNLVIPPYADKLWNNYWYFDEGFLSWSYGQMGVQLGVKRNSAGPGNTYKLFLEEKDFSYPTVRLLASGEKFKVETLWGGLRLFENASQPVKALNYRSLAFFPVEGLEIAYEDAVLYLHRFFDPYYFLVPIPIPGIQEFWHLNAPWGYSTTQLDDNSMVGAYVKYSDNRYSVYGEILLDDINMNRFLNPEGFQNPDKIAFLVGFTGKSGPYKVTFEVAGATAFTFERSTFSRPYEYVYFEGSNLPIEKNMIGYLHGENNIACSIALEYSNNGWSISTLYEGLIYGTRTPEKPWHDGTIPSGTHWLVGELTSQFSFKGRVAYTFKDLPEYLGELTVGFRFGFVGEKPFIGFDLSSLFDVNL